MLYSLGHRRQSEFGNMNLRVVDNTVAIVKMPPGVKRIAVNQKHEYQQKEVRTIKCGPRLTVIGSIHALAL